MMCHRHKTQRCLVFCLAIGMGLLASVLSSSVLGVVPQWSDASVKVDPKIPIEAYAFGLEDVRLLDGPFKEAMERDAAYLLRLEPDRLLHRFRANAGLEPKAPIYDGWETRGISGHSLGHYLSACALMYASTGNVEFYKRARYIVDELEICQNVDAAGFVGGIQDAHRVFSEVKAGDIRSQGFDLNGCWVPWYTEHKLFAGLIDVYRYCDSDKALRVVTKLGDWACDLTSGLSDELFQKMLHCEHGGMNESLVELYAVTGDRKYLALSRQFHHKAVLDPLAQERDCLPGLHANTQIPKIIGVARRYEVTADKSDKTIAEFFWDTVVYHHSYVIGGHSNHEHFGQPDELNDRLSSSTTETCNTYNMLKLTRHLFTWQASRQYADYYERALYNHILASQNPDDGMVCYFVPLKSGDFKRYSNPFHDFTCCHGTGMENHAKYGDSIYFHKDDTLFVNLFIPSELNWSAKGLKVRQETDYPAGDTVTLTTACDRPVDVTLKIRCPGWATAPLTITVNGRAVEAQTQAAGYAAIQRRWRNGDKVQVQIPMGLYAEAMPDNLKRAAVLYGPIVLAGDLGSIDRDEDLRIPVLVTQGKSPVQWLDRVDSDPLAFKTVGAGRPEDVTMIPFYRMHHRRYGVYWDFFSAEEWTRHEEAYLAEQQRLKELKARTVDILRIGEMQPERDHNFQGQSTRTGEFNGRKWRDATDGGWFSFEMKVNPEKPMELLCTYWGSDTGSRRFDILVDGQKIATQSLNENRPGEFFDAAYPIPAELTEAKEKVTVRLQAHPDRWAGGLFGCRTMIAQ